MAPTNGEARATSSGAAVHELGPVGCRRITIPTQPTDRPSDTQRTVLLALSRAQDTRRPPVLHMPRMWTTKLLSKRSVRASALSTATVATAAASAPSVPTTPFSDNSRASIAAVSELADSLDFMFEKINYEGKFSSDPPLRASSDLYSHTHQRNPVTCSSCTWSGSAKKRPSTATRDSSPTTGKSGTS